MNSLGIPLLGKLKLEAICSLTFLKHLNNVGGTLFICFNPAEILAVKFKVFGIKFSTVEIVKIVFFRARSKKVWKHLLSHALQVIWNSLEAGSEKVWEQERILNSGIGRGLVLESSQVLYRRTSVLPIHWTQLINRLPTHTNCFIFVTSSQVIKQIVTVYICYLVFLIMFSHHSHSATFNWNQCWLYYIVIQT